MLKARVGKPDAVLNGGRYIDMKIILLTFIVIVFSFDSFAQIKSEEFIKAHPVIGWDSLKTIIERPENYPSILQMAGVTGDFYLSLLIDSTGALSNVEPANGYKYMTPSDSITCKNYIIPLVKKILRPVKWIPCYLGGRPITRKIYLSFNFFLFDEKDKGFNIMAPRLYEEKETTY